MVEDLYCERELPNNRNRRIRYNLIMNCNTNIYLHKVYKDYLFHQTQ